MRRDTMQEQVVAVAEKLPERTGELAVPLAGGVTREVRLYPSAAPTSFDVLAGGCAANTRPTSPAPTPAKPNSARPPRPSWESHAHATGVPLSIVMKAGKLLSPNVTGV
ncbi:hypothetical protein [Mycobacterium sp.]|uniref:hypothetical protein n=1 Tax=Mycobacterium sp. TaxID=1785 RepID=UPI002C52FFCC|nr:hypothetical protein [Mycobacterium sp.]HME46601.1 hypothetical protein [Mycobacterium sp.]